MIGCMVGGDGVFMEKEGNGRGEEIVGLRSSSQARSGRKIWNSEESLEFGE